MIQGYRKEAEEQAILFKWAEIMTASYPELAVMYHIPNGGKRDKIEAAHLKRQGVKAGVPDVCLPVPKGKYHGLYIEMKRIGGDKPRENQRKWLEVLTGYGYKTAVCYGADEAVLLLRWYLELEEEQT